MKAKILGLHAALWQNSQHPAVQGLRSCCGLHAALWQAPTPQPLLVESPGLGTTAPSRCLAGGRCPWLVPRMPMHFWAGQCQQGSDAEKHQGRSGSLRAEQSLGPLYCHILAAQQGNYSMHSSGKPLEPFCAVASF